MKPFKLLFVAMGASLLLGALASTGSARNFSTSSQSLGAVFRSVTINLPFGNTVCAITLSGSLHARTIAKVAGALIGYINRASLGACSSGAATILTETLPWHLTYTEFSGRLPLIQRIGMNVLNASFRVQEPFGVTCLMRGLTIAVLRLIVEVTIVGVVAIMALKTLAGAIRAGVECFGAEATISSDRAPVATVAGGTTRITLALI